MRSKWKDWDYLNIWIFGGAAVADLVSAIMIICAGDYVTGFWTLSVSLYAMIVAYLSCRLFVARRVADTVVKDAIEFRDGRKSLRLGCGAIVRMRVIIPPVLDGHADGHDGRKRDDDGSDGLRDIAPGDGLGK